jgi:hypothetical protein
VPRRLKHQQFIYLATIVSISSATLAVHASHGNQRSFSSAVVSDTGEQRRLRWPSADCLGSRRIFRANFARRDADFPFPHRRRDHHDREAAGGETALDNA